MTRFVALMKLNAAQQRVQLQFVFAEAAIVPPTIYYLGTRLAGGDESARLRWLAGAITISIGGTAMSLAGMSALLDRFKRRNALLCAQGVSKGTYLTMQVSTSALAVLAFAGGFVCLASRAHPLGLFDAAKVASACVIGGISCASFGLVLASAARGIETGASAIIVGSYALLLASPIFYDESALPKPFSLACAVSPLVHINTIVSGAFRGESISLHSFGALVGLALVFGAASYKWFQWDR